MDRPNYNHLLYFWTVAKEGSVAAACRRLHLTQPTVSGQIRVLESSLGHKLFERRGRGLALTEMGRVVFRHAEEIFSIGAELMSAVRGNVPDERQRLRVGVVDVLPKLVVYRMLLPALSQPDDVRVVCYEGKQEELIARLGVHDLDVILSDAPAPSISGAAVHSHRLGESGIAMFASAALARKYRRGFPGSLEGAPLLLPTPNTAVRRAVDHWLESHRLRPRVIGEFEDTALLKVFGQSGAGLFVAPNIIEPDITSKYDVRLVGRLVGAREQFYALTVERRIRHPAVAMLTDAARSRLSGSQ